MSNVRSTARKKVDATIDLLLSNEAIERDLKILQYVQDRVRRNMSKPAWLPPTADRPSLYKRYRGRGFPLRDHLPEQAPAWTRLTPWMKAQVAGLCLHSVPFKVFTITLHEELMAELRDRGGPNPKKYLSVCSKKR